MLFINSNIINKYYTKLERIGLKKHQITKNEIQYLESLSKHDRNIELINESDFNINRIKFKKSYSKIFSLILLLLSIKYYNYNISILLIIISIILIYYNFYLNKKLRFYYFSKGLSILDEID